VSRMTRQIITNHDEISNMRIFRVVLTTSTAAVGTTGAAWELDELLDCKGPAATPPLSLTWKPYCSAWESLLHLSAHASLPAVSDTRDD
jgi:hypothetical protein